MKKTTATMRMYRSVLVLLILAPLLFAADRPDTLGAGTPASGGLVKIGTITAESRTVSSLLLRNRRLKKSCWDIINSERNRGKNFAGIQTGTEVYYDPATKELLWADATSKTSPAAVMPETAFEFPAVVEGEKVTRDFMIRNRGNANLAVLGVKTS